MTASRQSIPEDFPRRMPATGQEYTLQMWKLN